MVKCIGDGITVMPRPTRCSIISGGRIPSFPGRNAAKADHRLRPRTSFIPPRFAEGRFATNVDLGLVDEFKTVSSFASKPVKITMTGPHLLAAVAHDEYYQDTPRMIGDFGKLLHQNLKHLAEAGCKHVQIDEPYFTMAADDEVRTAVDAINAAIEGLPNDMHIMMHICQGD